MAVNLAIALVRDGRRTLLVDGNPQRAGVAAQCALADEPNIGDVLAGLRSLHEAMQSGPAGIQVLPGQWDGKNIAAWTPRALERLLTELRGLGQYTDVVLIDVGATIDVVSRHFWRSADEIVLVTSPDNVAVMDAYASVKSHCDDGKSTRIATLVNQAMDALTAQDAHARLQRACHRFLSVDTRVLGSVPMDAAVRTATVAMRPFLVQAPHGAAALELTRIVGRMIVTPKGTARPVGTCTAEIDPAHAAALR